MKKKILCALTVFCLIFAMIPIRAMATSAGTDGGTYAIAVTVAEGGSHGVVELSASGADAQERVFLLADPDDGYLVEFEGSYDSDCHDMQMTYLGRDTYMIIMPDGDVRLDIRFVKAPGREHDLRLSVSDPRGGTIGASRNCAREGEAVIVTVVPSPGWILDQLHVSCPSGWEVEGRYLGEEDGVEVFEVIMPCEAVQLHAQLLNRQVPFQDVDESHYFYEPVLWAVKNGITQGVSNTRFGPCEGINRAAAVTMLWRWAGCPEPTAAQNPFRDVHEGDFFCKAALWAVENGITKGIRADQFGPEQPCTRAQAVTFLWRFLGQPKPRTGTNPFTDVPDGSFYAEAVLWALERDVTTGAGGAAFDPDGQCLRGQFVTFLYRAARLPEAKGPTDP